MKYVFIVLLATIFSFNYASETSGDKTLKMDKKIEKVGLKLCADCGEIKGSDKCCVPEAEKCPKCGLNKGAPGCCKIEKGVKDVKLCTDCGEIKGSDKCCVPEAEKCPKCGLNKGAPGCCKIEKK